MTAHLPPAVQIAIITYNQEGLVSASIESALAQDYGNLSIVIYDDCSTDGTSNICQYYAEKDGRITYHRHPANLGMVGNAKYAVDHAAGEYFVLLLGDDLLYPDFIHETVELGLNRHPGAAFAYTLHERLINNELTGDMYQFIPALPTGEHDVLKYLCLTNWIITSFAVIRTANLKQIGGLSRFINKNTQAHGDQYLFALLAATGPAFVVNKRLGAYRIHEETSTANLVKSKRYKECAIHCYDAIFQDMDVFEDKYRYIAKANQIGRLLTSRGIIASAIDMMNSPEIHDLMATFTLDLSITLLEALEKMVFDTPNPPGRDWKLEHPANMVAFSEFILKKFKGTTP